MAEVAVGLQIDEARNLLAPTVVHQRLEVVIEVQHIKAIDDPSFDAIGIDFLSRSWAMVVPRSMEVPIE